MRRKKKVNIRQAHIFDLKITIKEQNYSLNDAMINKERVATENNRLIKERDLLKIFLYNFFQRLNAIVVMVISFGNTF